MASCVNLKNLYLQQNLLSGEITHFLFNLPNLVRLNMAFNNFSGPISTSFNNFTRLKTLYLKNNHLSGSIPELTRLGLHQFNVSNSILNGSVPDKLRTFPQDSFLGNSLCGPPLSLCPGTEANASSPFTADGGNTTKKKNRLSEGAIAGIVIGFVVFFLLLVFLLIFLCRNKSSKKASAIDVATVKHPESDVPRDKSIFDLENGNGYASAVTAEAALVAVNKVEADGNGNTAGGATIIKGVYENIRCDKGDRIRFKSDVLEFNQMSEVLNQKSAVHGKIPSGYFNALFDLSHDWLRDASDIKRLAFDGFIQTYGTHIVVGMAVGGQDVICVKQKHSSKIPPGDIRRHLEDLGDFLFSDVRSPSSLQRKTADSKQKVPEVFNRVMQSNTMQFTSISETSSKDGLTIICSKRGGDVYKHSHSNWLQTVPSNPEAIKFKFVPISSLLAGIPGSGYLSHAINLYLRYKPSPEDLQYFLEFQIPRQWAPMFCELPLRHQRRKTSSLSLQFCFFGPKLQISSTQVVSDQKPVVGLRLYLEGKKSDRLALHINHLSSLPNKMILSSDTSTPSVRSMWRGSNENETSNQFLEPIRWKRFSNICTAVVKHDPNWLNNCGGVYIVTGAQLITKGSWPRNVLHLCLLFTHITNCTIRKSEWDAAPEASRKSSFLTNLSTTFSFTQQSITAAPPKQPPTSLNSGIYPNGPPVPVRSSKLLKYVETAEVLRGPHDAPGHWMVTAAKLVTDGGKIGLQVKFALLDYW